MPLGRLQTLLIDKLEEMGRFTAEQRAAIVDTPQDLPGEALDQLLQKDYNLTPFQILLGKSKAYGIAPFLISRYKINNGTFERLDRAQTYTVISTDYQQMYRAVIADRLRPEAMP